MKNQKNAEKTTPNVVVGIDVSQAMLDIYVNSSGEHAQYANDPDGLKKLVAMLRKLKPTLVIFEATGNYEHALMMALGHADIPFHQVNPRWTRAYAVSRGQLAKTDKVDAKLLAEFAAERSPEAHEMPSQREVELDELLRWHRQLTLQKAKLKTQLKQARSAFVVKEIQAVLDTCLQKLAAVEAAIDKLIRDDPESQAREEILRSVPGIGPQAARTLIVALPELGRMNKAQVASLAGVAPMNCDSGRHRGQRHIRGGRAPVRRTIFAAISSSVTRGFNPVLHAVYTRLRAAGKSYKVAMTACVRKMLVTLNTMLRNGTKWQQPS